MNSRLFRLRLAAARWLLAGTGYEPLLVDLDAYGKHGARALRSMQRRRALIAEQDRAGEPSP